MSDIVSIPLDKIDIGARMRPSYDAAVAALAASIRETAAAGIGHDGLRQPIEVRLERDRYTLVSGLHRLRAIEMLERTEIAAISVEADDLRAEMLEMEENLVRSDLTALDRAIFVARFREVFQAEYGAIEHGGDRKSEDFKGENQNDNVSLWSDALLNRLGMSLRAAQRSFRIAKHLHPKVIDPLRAMPWADNQKALLELAAVTPTDMQIVVVDRLADPANAAWSMRDAIAGGPTPKDGDPREVWFGRARELVAKGDIPQRRRFYTDMLVNDIDVLREAVEASGFTLVMTRKGSEGDT